MHPVPTVPPNAHTHDARDHDPAIMAATVRLIQQATALAGVRPSMTQIAKCIGISLSALQGYCKPPKLKNTLPFRRIPPPKRYSYPVVYALQSLARAGSAATGAVWSGYDPKAQHRLRMARVAHGLRDAHVSDTIAKAAD